MPKAAWAWPFLQQPAPPEGQGLQSGGPCWPLASAPTQVVERSQDQAERLSDSANIRQPPTFPLPQTVSVLDGQAKGCPTALPGAPGLLF